MLLTRDSFSGYLPYVFDIQPWAQYALLAMEKDKLNLEYADKFNTFSKDLGTLGGLAESLDPEERQIYLQYVDFLNKRNEVAGMMSSGVPSSLWMGAAIELYNDKSNLDLVNASLNIRNQLRATYATDSDKYIYTDNPNKISLKEIASGYMPQKIDVDKVKKEAERVGQAYAQGVSNDDLSLASIYGLYQLTHRTGYSNEELELKFANGDFNDTINLIYNNHRGDLIKDPSERDRFKSIILEAFKVGAGIKGKYTSRYSNLPKSGSSSSSGSSSKSKGKQTLFVTELGNRTGSVQSQEQLKTNTKTKSASAQTGRDDDYATPTSNKEIFNKLSLIYSLTYKKTIKLGNDEWQRISQFKYKKVKKAEGGNLYYDGDDLGKEDIYRLLGTNKDPFIGNHRANKEDIDRRFDNNFGLNIDSNVQPFLSKILEDLYNESLDPDREITMEETLIAGRNNIMKSIKEAFEPIKTKFNKIGLAAYGNFINTPDEENLQELNKSVNGLITKDPELHDRYVLFSNLLNTYGYLDNLIKTYDNYLSLIYNLYNLSDPFKLSVDTSMFYNDQWEKLNKFNLSPTVLDRVKATYEGTGGAHYNENASDDAARIALYNMHDGNYTTPNSIVNALLLSISINPADYIYSGTMIQNTELNNKIYNAAKDTSYNSTELNLVDDKNKKLTVYKGKSMGGKKFILNQDKSGGEQLDPSYNYVVGGNLNLTGAFRNTSGALGNLFAYFFSGNRDYKVNIMDLVSKGTHIFDRKDGVGLDNKEKGYLQYYIASQGCPNFTKKIKGQDALISANEFKDLLLGWAYNITHGYILDNKQKAMLRANKGKGNFVKARSQFRTGGQDKINENVLRLYTGINTAINRYTWLMANLSEMHLNDDGYITVDEAKKAAVTIANSKRGRTDDNERLNKYGLGENTLNFTFNFTPDERSFKNEKDRTDGYNQIIANIILEIQGITESDIANGEFVINGTFVNEGDEDKSETKTGGLIEKNVVLDNKFDRIISNENAKDVSDNLKKCDRSKKITVSDGTRSFLYNVELNKVGFDVNIGADTSNNSKNSFSGQVYLPIDRFLRTNKQLANVNTLNKQAKELHALAVYYSRIGNETKAKTAFSVFYDRINEIKKILLDNITKGISVRLEDGQEKQEE